MLFFPASSAYAGAMQSFATYAVGFAARPVGAAIFGHWGDRIGRKTTLIITLLVMGIASAVVGFLPGTASIGFAAPLILVMLRLVQGIAIGGEWSGSVLLAMEWGAQDRRGLLGQFGADRRPRGAGARHRRHDPAFGNLVDRGVQLLGLAGAVHGEPDAGGGRSGDPAEDPRDADVRQGACGRKTASTPVMDAIRQHWREILLSAGARFSEQMPFYLYTTFVLTFVVARHDYSKTLCSLRCSRARCSNL